MVNTLQEELKKREEFLTQNNIPKGMQEFKDTGSFSRNIENQYKESLNSPINNVAPISSLNTPKEILPDTSNIGSPKELNAPEDFVLKQQNENITKNTLNKLETQKQKDISSNIKAYNINKGLYENDKNLYKNFDVVNQKVQSIFNDLENIQRTGQDLTEQQYQEIANKYGVDINEVKNPNNLFKNQLELTEKGKFQKGVTGAENSIDNLQTSYERSKSDLYDNLESQKTNINNQISDIQTQIQRNLQFMVKQGVWNGAIDSSGYQQGLENVKMDGEKTISRLQDLLQKVENASSENIGRLTEDYNNALSQAKDNLNNQLENIRFQSGVQLEGLSDKYGIGNDTLTAQLDKISEFYGMQSQQVFNSYLANIKNIDTITNEKIRIQEENDLKQKEKLNNRYNEYLLNDGLLLQNTNINDLQSEVNRGLLSIDKFNDLQNIMLSSVTNYLSEIGQLNEEDLQKIETLFSQGKTINEIIANISQSENFKQQISPTDRYQNIGGKVFDIIEGNFINNNIGSNNITSNVGGFTENMTIDRPKGSTNVGRDINNAGNITSDSIPAGYTKESYGNLIGAIGTYKSPNGREYFVFENPDDGRVALYNDIKAKQSGQSQTGLNGNSTLSEFVSIYTGEGESYINSLAEDLGVNIDTPISQIPTEDLTTAVELVETGGLNDNNIINNQTDIKNEGLGEYESTVKGIVKGIGELSDFTNTEKGKIVPILQKYIKTLETDDKDRNRIIRSSLSKKNPSDTTLNKLQDMNTVKFQLDNLENTLKNQKSGPILGKISKFNPYDTDAQVALAQLAGLTPKVARGIFGEVGVLTDNDIANYQKALPNLTSTEEKNKLIINFMRKLLAEGYKNAIITQSKGGVNMSEFLDDYDEINNTLNGRQFTQEEALKALGGQSLASEGIKQSGQIGTSTNTIDSSKPVYIDKDGIEYNNDALILEIDKQLTDGTATQEQINQWLQDNNIILQ